MVYYKNCECSPESLSSHYNFHDFSLKISGCLFWIVHVPVSEQVTGSQVEQVVVS